MMSRTVRYFKLMYIVAGILMSNEGVCETVDQIQIAPNVEVKEMLQPRKVYRGVEKVSKSWLRKCDIFGLLRIKQRLRPMLSALTIGSLTNYVLDYSTKRISKMFILGSDCDMIYNR